MSERLRAVLAAFDPSLPLERASGIPPEWYTDPEVAALERRAVFHDTWQMVGTADAVAAPGSFLTADVAGEPVLVARDQGGALRAFSNVCRHRAAVVVPEACGTATKFRCRYHGWTYDLAGRLRGVPEFDGVQDFRREDHGLPELPVAEWGPTVWVHLGRPAKPLAETLAPLPDMAAPLVAGLRRVTRVEYEVGCNWKVYVDNYLDGGYHVNTVHPGLAGVLDYAKYRTDLYESVNVQVSPLVADGTATGAVRTGEAAYYWWAFPNFMVNLYSGVMDTNLVLPVAADRCRVVFDFYFATDDPRFADESVAVADRIQDEDKRICEDVQRGLSSRRYRAGRFSVRREAGGYQFHRMLAARLRG